MLRLLCVSMLIMITAERDYLQTQLAFRFQLLSLSAKKSGAKLSQVLGVFYVYIFHIIRA